ncbi:hypothetical protein Goarm_010100 [Gossypium armourianum]|uniref:DJ-1/PfpI domain-containing protein n=1 Tax=Gossypium armourianum TaxID=34283 RepID=A0A7J9JV02_9ROSI|nr:hypothetical protein [Gossypium armourianum]
MPGATNFKDCAVLESVVKKQAADGRLYAAVCASPAVALGSWGLLKGLKATCYPSFMEQLSSCATAVESIVQQDGKVVTSRGPGTTMEFSVALVEQLYDKEKADEVSGPLLLRPNHGDEYKVIELNPMEWKCNNIPQVRFQCWLVVYILLSLCTIADPSSSLDEDTEIKVCLINFSDPCTNC